MKKVYKLPLLTLLTVFLSFVFFACALPDKNAGDDTSEDEDSQSGDALLFTELEDGSYSVRMSKDSEEKIIRIPEYYCNKPVTEIEDNGFNSAFISVGIEEVYIPSSVKHIGADAFDGMSSLKKVYVDDISSYLKIEFGTLFSNPLVFAGNLYVGGELLTELTVPDSITVINDYALLCCRSLERLTLHDGVERIGASAFENCENLSYVLIGESLLEISRSAFYGCQAVEEFVNRSGIDFTQIIQGVKDTVKIDNKSTGMIGHAGLAGVEMQNTEAGFRYAGMHTYYGIETDIRKTGDGNFVCFHDPNLLASAGVDSSIENMALAEIKAVTLYDERGGTTKDKGYKILSLSEYIEICKEYGKRAIIELKTPLNREDVGRVIEIVEECGYIENSTFISFFYDNLLLVRSFLPSAKVGFTFKTAGDDVEAVFKKIVNDRFNVNMSTNVVTDEWIERFHAEGLEITCYTIDDPTVAENLVKMGVDYIITNKLE